MATTDPTLSLEIELTENQKLAGINADYDERYGFRDAENYLYKAPKGINREIVEKISEFKSEPQWMRDFRLKALEYFFARPQPTWGSPMLAEVDYDDIHYLRALPSGPSAPGTTMPEDVKNTFDRLGDPWRPSASSSPASGPGYESEVVGHQINEELTKQGRDLHRHGHGSA